MLYVLAIFAPWLALLFVRKWGQAIFISSPLMVFACVGFFLFVIPGVILWLIAIIHAVVVIHGVKTDKRTDKIVSAIQSKQTA